MKKVLIIEDEVELAELLAEALAHHELKISCAHTILAATERLATENFNLIILDLVMPGMKSETAAADLLARVPKPLMGTPIIIVTGYDTFDVPEGLTCIARIQKPFHLKSVRALIYDHFGIEHEIKMESPSTHSIGNKALKTSR